MTITVAIPVHPRRIDNGMLDRALRSVHSQILRPSAVAVALDIEAQGAPRTRQRALDMAQTPWVAFLDSDDYFWPDHLQVLYDAAEQTGADYIYSWFETNPPGNSPFPEGHFLDPWDPDNPRQTTITTLVRTELAQAVGFWDVGDEQRFPDGLRVGEDWEFTLGCNRLGKIHHVVQRTWSWSMHGNNSSGRPGQGDA